LKAVDRFDKDGAELARRRQQSADLDSRASGQADAQFSVHGVAEIGFVNRDGSTRLNHLYQCDPLRVLFPQPEADEPPQAVIVTTSGGLVAGDRIDVSVTLDEGAAAHVTASAAEKIYRSLGRTTAVTQAMRVGNNAILEFLPPETILFDNARLHRVTTVEIAPRGAFLGGDIVIFGRRDRGERFTQGLLHDIWEIQREGRLIWGDALHLDGDIARVIEDPACFDGAAGFATLIWAPAGDDLHPLFEGARRIQSATTHDDVRSGMSIVNGLLIARWLGFDARRLRQAYADLVGHLRSEALNLPGRLPRLWHV
jgi:urease accessory protein